MQENTDGTPHKPETGSTNTKGDEKSSLSAKVGQIAVGCAVVPIAAVAIGCTIVSTALDAVWDSAEAIADRVTDKVTDGVTIVKDKATEKVEAILDSEKVEAILDNEKVKAIFHTIDNKLDHNTGTVKLAKGAAQVGYGLLRGGLAVSGALGHGLAGFFMRRHTPGVAAKIIKHGFEAASDNIEEGAEIFKEGLDERRKQ